MLDLSSRSWKVYFMFYRVKLILPNSLLHLFPLTWKVFKTSLTSFWYLILFFSSLFFFSSIICFISIRDFTLGRGECLRNLLIISDYEVMLITAVIIIVAKLLLPLYLVVALSMLKLLQNVAAQMKSFSFSDKACKRGKKCFFNFKNLPAEHYL